MDSQPQQQQLTSKYALTRVSLHSAHQHVNMQAQPCSARKAFTARWKCFHELSAITALPKHCWIPVLHDLLPLRCTAEQSTQACNELFGVSWGSLPNTEKAHSKHTCVRHPAAWQMWQASSGLLSGLCATSVCACIGSAFECTSLPPAQIAPLFKHWSQEVCKFSPFMRQAPECRSLPKKAICICCVCL